MHLASPCGCFTVRPTSPPSTQAKAESEQGMIGSLNPTPFKSHLVGNFPLDDILPLTDYLTGKGISLGPHLGLPYITLPLQVRKVGGPKHVCSERAVQELGPSIEFRGDGWIRNIFYSVNFRRGRSIQ